MAEEKRVADTDPPPSDIPTEDPARMSADEDISEAQLALLEGTKIATAQLAAEISRHAELWQKTHKPVEPPRLREEGRAADRKNATRPPERIPPRLVRAAPTSDQAPQPHKTVDPVEPTLTKPAPADASPIATPAPEMAAAEIAVEQAEKSHLAQQKYWPVSAPEDLDRRQDKSVADKEQPAKRRRGLYSVVMVIVGGMIVVPVSWNSLFGDRMVSPSSIGDTASSSPADIARDDAARPVAIDIPVTMPPRDMAPPPSLPGPSENALWQEILAAEVPAPQDILPKPKVATPAVEEIAAVVPETKADPAPKATPPKKVTLTSVPAKPALTPSADAMRAKPFEPSASLNVPQPFASSTSPARTDLPKSTPAATSNSWLKAQPFQP